MAIFHINNIVNGNERKAYSGYSAGFRSYAIFQKPKYLQIVLCMNVVILGISTNRNTFGSHGELKLLFSLYFPENFPTLKQVKMWANAILEFPNFEIY